MKSCLFKDRAQAEKDIKSLLEVATSETSLPIGETSTSYPISGDGHSFNDSFETVTCTRYRIKPTNSWLERRRALKIIKQYAYRHDDPEILRQANKARVKAEEYNSKLFKRGLKTARNWAVLASILGLCAVLVAECRRDDNYRNSAGLLHSIECNENHLNFFKNLYGLATNDNQELSPFQKQKLSEAESNFYESITRLREGVNQGTIILNPKLKEQAERYLNIPLRKSAD
jgi:hypothetical protein